MGLIPSSTTIDAQAYLTDRGREYLFNQNNIRFDSNGDDLFEIVTFALGDPDANYRAIKQGSPLTTGGVPDLTGKAEGCLKATSEVEQNSLIIHILDTNIPLTFEYTANPNPLDILEGTIPVSNETPPTAPGPIKSGGPAQTPFGG